LKQQSADEKDNALRLQLINNLSVSTCFGNGEVLLNRLLKKSCRAVYRSMNKRLKDPGTPTIILKCDLQVIQVALLPVLKVTGWEGMQCTKY
jgi:hypothetical protein